MEKYERLERNLVHKGVIIDYYQDTIKVPNGNIATWDFIGHKGAAAVVAVNAEGKLLMVRQYRNALDRETLEIPAGGLEGEPTDVAAARELEEETGYKAGKLEFLISIYTTVAFCNEKIDIYLATNLVPSRGMEQDKSAAASGGSCQSWYPEGGRQGRRICEGAVPAARNPFYIGGSGCAQPCPGE